MNAMRRYAYAVFGVACTHLVFGAIVRISGSGMGCGPHWPKCYGYWFPPFDRMDLVIEVLHRYLASVLLLSLIGLVVAAWRRRGEPGVGGRGGVLRSAALAMALGFGAALLGAVTVKLSNSPPATVAHWTVAMSLVAAVTATVIRAGGLGGATARLGGVSGKTRRGTLVAAGLALLAVVMGGLTAKVQGGPVACLAFPLCGANPDVPRGAVHVQSTHRVIAVLLVLHLIGLFFALRKRREASVVRRATSIALALGVLQLLVAGAMIGMHLPPVLRSLHEAIGVSIWISTFALAYLSRLGSDDIGLASGIGGAPVAPAAPIESEAVAAASLRAPASGPRSALASAMPAPASASLARRTPERAVRAVDAPDASPSGSAAAPVLDVAIVVGRYLPTAAPVTVMEPAPRAPDEARAVPGPRRLADEAIELPAAREHGSRAAVTSGLEFNRLAADAAIAAAHDVEIALAVDAEPEMQESPIAAAVADVSEVDYADVVDVEVLDVVGDVGVSARDAGVDALACATMPGRRPDDLVASLVRTLVVAKAAGVTEAAAATDVEIAGRGAPPEEEDTTAGLADHHHFTAPLAESIPASDDAAHPVAEQPAAMLEPVAAAVSLVATPPLVAVADVVETPAIALAIAAVAAQEAVVAPADADAAMSEAAVVTTAIADALAVVAASGAAVVAEPVGERGLEAASELAIARGGPPTDEDTIDTGELPHEFAARVTIFDEIASGDVDDGLYNLVDEDDDAGERDAEADDVLSLDEEFSRLTLGDAADEYEDEGVLVEALAAAPVPAIVPAAPAPLTALSSLAALRRPAMAHSVAVIVARGADF